MTTLHPEIFYAEATTAQTTKEKTHQRWHGRPGFISAAWQVLRLQGPWPVCGSQPPPRPLFLHPEEVTARREQAVACVEQLGSHGALGAKGPLVQTRVLRVLVDCSRGTSNTLRPEQSLYLARHCEQPERCLRLDALYTLESPPPGALGGAVSRLGVEIDGPQHFVPGFGAGAFHAQLLRDYALYWHTVHVMRVALVRVDERWALHHEAEAAQCLRAIVDCLQRGQLTAGLYVVPQQSEVYRTGLFGKLLRNDVPAPQCVGHVPVVALGNSVAAPQVLTAAEEVEAQAREDRTQTLTQTLTRNPSPNPNPNQVAHQKEVEANSKGKHGLAQTLGE